MVNNTRQDTQEQQDNHHPNTSQGDPLVDKFLWSLLTCFSNLADKTLSMLHILKNVMRSYKGNYTIWDDDKNARGRTYQNFRQQSCFYAITLQIYRIIILAWKLAKMTLWAHAFKGVLLMLCLWNYVRPTMTATKFQRLHQFHHFPPKTIPATQRNLNF